VVDELRDDADRPRLFVAATRDDLKGQVVTVVGCGLYADGVKLASFAEGRIGYREWARRNGRLADIHNIDDRYDHDIDELMA
jgi:hypothetical protein